MPTSNGKMKNFSVYKIGSSQQFLAQASQEGKPNSMMSTMNPIGQGSNGIIGKSALTMGKSDSSQGSNKPIDKKKKLENDFKNFTLYNASHNREALKHSLKQSSINTGGM
jgi:hypothetical protein